MLGWRVAEEERQALPFAKVFHLLGASFNLSKTFEGVLEVGNKDGRLEALEDVIESICNRKQLHYTKLAKLRGKLMYASTHTFGRVE